MTIEDVRESPASSMALFAALSQREQRSTASLMDMLDAFRYLGALAIVLALVGGAGIAIRRYGLPGLAGMGRRLAITDSLMLGRNQRAIILRCDGMEHIVITTPQGATVIASAPAKAEIVERAAA